MCPCPSAPVGVAVDDGHIIDVHAEALPTQAGQRCFVALAMAVRTGENFHRSTAFTRPRPIPQADTGPQRPTAADGAMPQASI